MKSHPIPQKRLSRSLPWIAWALICVPFLLAAAPAMATDETAEAAEKRLVRLTLKGAVSEHAVADFSLLGGPAQTIKIEDIQKALAKVAADPSAEGLVLRLKGASMGWSQRDAVRRALLDFRKSGKPACVFLESAGLSDYMLASACTDISLAPSGGIELPGVSMQKMYLKGLLDMVGLQMQELRMGRYKSAIENMTRTEPSAPVVEETEALIEGLYSDVVASLAENLGRKPVEVRALIDHAVFSPTEAKEHGLVHHVEYEDQMLARIRGENKMEITGADMGAGAGASQYQGFAGMMKLMNELFSPTSTTESAEPRIAVVHGTGAISTGGGTPNPLAGGEALTSNEMVPLFRKLRADDNVKAVVFRVDSPGGSALASDLIAREVELTAKVKPVVVSMGNLAASGGYYISAPASWIVAENATLTGSIGVIGGILNTKAVYDRAGVRYETFSRGKRAGMISPYGELSEEGRDMFMSSMREIYDTFLSIVAKGRNLPKSAVASVAEGRVWTGGQALGLGLVDQIGSYDDALAKARALAKVEDDIDVVHLPRAKTLFDMMNDMTGEGAAVALAVRALPRELQSLIHKVSWAWSLRDERVMAVMPDVYEIR